MPSSHTPGGSPLSRRAFAALAGVTAGALTEPAATAAPATDRPVPAPAPGLAPASAGPATAAYRKSASNTPSPPPHST
ncbi:hypothetical protein [Streptomyces sp. NPDC048496]|uniref:hypothetical protein n=1 Tax=Streptomyces sp. NPDC048496 TaxID=3365558 RepID=UPI003722C14B